MQGAKSDKLTTTTSTEMLVDEAALAEDFPDETAADVAFGAEAEEEVTAIAAASADAVALVVALVAFPCVAVAPELAADEAEEVDVAESGAEALDAAELEAAVRLVAVPEGAAEEAEGVVPVEDSLEAAAEDEAESAPDAAAEVVAEAEALAGGAAALADAAAGGDDAAPCTASGVPKPESLPMFTPLSSVVQKDCVGSDTSVRHFCSIMPSDLVSAAPGQTHSRGDLHRRLGHFHHGASTSLLALSPPAVPRDRPGYRFFLGCCSEGVTTRAQARLHPARARPAVPRRPVFELAPADPSSRRM